MPPPSHPSCGCFPTKLSMITSESEPAAENKAMAFNVATLDNALAASGKITKKPTVAEEVQDLRDELKTVKDLLMKLVSVAAPSFVLPMVMSGSSDSSQKTLLKG